MIGQLIKDTYRIYDKVGTGGFATVYVGRNIRTNEVVAIKILRQEYTEEPEFITRFQWEARMARQLEHPNLVRMIDYGLEGNLHYLVMEYVEGRTLAELIRERGALPVDEVVSIAIQVCRALDVAQRAGVVHRDIKPHNIMITPAGVVKVMDFGIARMAASQALTQAGMLIGTPRYLSPEVTLGERADARSDLYALGIVLYELLSGDTPFVADSPWAIMRHQVETPPPPLRVRRPDVPVWLEKVVLKSLAKRREDRFQTPVEMLAALESKGMRTGVAAGQAATARARRRLGVVPLLLAILGLVVVLTVLLVVVLPDLEQSTRTPAEAATASAATAAALLQATLAVTGASPAPTPSLTAALAAAPAAQSETATARASPSATPTPTPTPTRTSMPTVTRGATRTNTPARTPASPTPSRTATATRRAGSPTAVSAATGVSTATQPAATQPPAPPGGGSLSGRIAFAVVDRGSGMYVLYSANLDGSDLRWLANHLHQPSYRQDGTLIVANGQGSGHDDLYEVAPHGGVTRQFGAPEDEHPVWIQTRKGYHIAVGSTRHGDGQWRIYLGDKAISYGSGEVRGRYPVWVPAESVAYSGCDYGFGTSSRCGLYRVPAGGGTPVQLTGDPNDITTGASEDGVLFSRQVDGNWDIYLVGLGGGTPQRLTDHAASDGLAAFSPDGRTIAFVSDRSGAWAVWLMARNGANQRKAFDLPGGGGYGADWTAERLTWGPLPAAPTPVPTEPGGELLPAPRITFPIPEDTVSSKRATSIRWTWTGTLAANQAFEVRFWHQTDPAPMGVAPPTTQMQLEVNLGLTESYLRHGETYYYLDVVVVQVEPRQVLSRNAPIRVQTDPNKR